MPYAFSVARDSSTRTGHSKLVDLTYPSTEVFEFPLFTARKTTGLPS